MSVDLDASVLVAPFTEDALTARADAVLRAHPTVAIVSDFAAAEFASAIARHVRMGRITPEGAREVFSVYDALTTRETERAQLVTADITSAAGFLRRLDLALRTGDAINIAIAQRIGADLLTFDDKMAACARELGTAILVG